MLETILAICALYLIWTVISGGLFSEYLMQDKKVDVNMALFGCRIFFALISPTLAMIWFTIAIIELAFFAFLVFTTWLFCEWSLAEKLMFKMTLKFDKLWVYVAKKFCEEKE